MNVYECKLIFHRKNKQNDEDILFCAKDFPDIKMNCLLEIYQLENEKHNLIKVDSINQTYQIKDTISIDQQLGNALRLIQNKTLKFKVINENVVKLDVLDLVLRDQYLSRSDMYRFTRSMRKSVLQIKKKQEFGPFRGQVGDMWCKGRRISCGYVGDNTRVVYRSATSVVHIFIQMSQEMWEFDYFGELYFDKAINFISDLFIRWNDNNCGHDVTIVLFSRLFYKNIYEDGISTHMKTDYKGRQYEDFYYIVVQNERYMLAEWRKVVKNLKLCFNQYKSDLNQFNQRNFGAEMETELSTADDANFLETLNMTLNLYENYYIDRNFDRTGKVCVVITAGPGVYNVDRVQTHLTKQRICDLGVGMDLVCMGEQPLHAVPLFIYHQKNSQTAKDNQYYIPYWINHSFYRSVNELQAIQLGKFIPRIKVRIEKIPDNEKSTRISCTDVDIGGEEFSASSKTFMRNLTKSECTQSESYGKTKEDDTNILSTSNTCDRSCLFASFSESYISKDDSCIRPAKSSIKRTKFGDNPKALFNPFAPNRFNVRTTSNSRRWSHVFPMDKNNKPIQLHHQLVINNPSNLGLQSKMSINMTEAWKQYYKNFENDKKISREDSLDLPSTPTTTTTKDTCQLVSPKALFSEYEEAGVNDNTGSDKTSDTSAILSPQMNSFQGTGSQKSFPMNSSVKSSVNRKVHTLFTEGEQKWSWDVPKEEDSPINHMGVDWKSLILPAILPITSDYFPSSKDLEDDFLESNYQLMANSVDINENGLRNPRKPLGINDVFQELILQRLNQGFQLIVEAPSFNSYNNPDAIKKQKSKRKSAVFRFGLGRIYHVIEMKQDLIYVTQYSPRHFSNVEAIPYNYCMKMIDSSSYMMFKTKFSIQVLEKFNWNYHDHYILNYGGNVEGDSGADNQQYKLIPSLKFWRSRFYLLPLHPATKTIMDVDKNTKFQCDIYHEKTVMEQNGLIDDFFKFLEVLNKIKRPTQNQKKATAQSAGIILSTNMTSPSKPQTHRHSTTLDPTFARMMHHHSSQSQLLEYPQNTSGPVTPLEKLQKQFTFDSTESMMKPLTPTENERLTDTSPIPKVLEAMTNLQTGMAFLPLNEFPNEYTFTSFDCVNWCRRNIDGISDVKTAVSYLKKLMSFKYISHATECPSHEFVYGFIFYCINSSCKGPNGSWQDLSDNSLITSNNGSSVSTGLEETDPKFKRRNIEWVEVSLASLEYDGKSEYDWYSELSGKKLTGFHLSGDFPRPIESIQGVEFLLPKLPNKILTNCFTKSNILKIAGNCHDPGMLYEMNNVLYKKVVLDIDNEKDERPEWGTFQFHANYHPTVAFEFMLQWIVATGGKLFEKVSHWSRRMYNFQLIAVPCDPFALPSSINSDPLRGPIYVPLNVKSLICDDKLSCGSVEETVDLLFSGFPGPERLERLMLMQEAVLKRFGFIKESCVNFATKERIEVAKKNKYGDFGERPVNIAESSPKWSYVHYSGGMFAMIPNYRIHLQDDQSDPLSTERTSSTSEDEDWDAPNIGFLWSWNKMLTRKANPASMTVDEQFQDRMLADFKDFCNNVDDRLRCFMSEARGLVERLFDDKREDI